MEIIIGRRGQQSKTITDATVSREHCKLTSNADGTYTLENLSQNGTFVEGKSIIRSVVTEETEIRLGVSYIVKIKELLPVTQQSASQNLSQYQKTQSKTIDSNQIEYQKKFQKLKDIYEKYTTDKIAIQKETAKTNFYRMLPMSIVALIGMGASAIPALGNIAPIVGGIGAVLLIFSIFKSYSGTNETPEKLQTLNDRFMVDYVCPKCGNFLGFIPYETLKNKKTCTYCKCKWT